MTSPSRAGFGHLSIPALVITAAVALCPAPAVASAGSNRRVAAPAALVAPSQNSVPKVSQPSQPAPQATPTSPSTTTLNPAVQVTMTSISAAPNSFVIGTDYPSFGESVSNTSIFSLGPGNWGGGNYVAAFIVGDFNHCGYIALGTSTPSQDDDTGQVTCSTLPRGVDRQFHADFKATYTDGQMVDGGAAGAPVTLQLNAPGCTPEGFGNVKPWVPDNEAGTDGFPLTSSTGTLNVTWRYVSKSGQFVMIIGPSIDGGPVWYFVPVQCAPSLELA